MTHIDDIHYAGPTGRELPGEHWNARIIREQATESAQYRADADALATELEQSGYRAEIIRAAANGST